MPDVIIYMRSEGLDYEEERQAAKEVFPVVELRTAIPSDCLVIPRYSALPYYKELESDVRSMGSRLLNSYEEHRYVADITCWAPDIEDVTPKTWDVWGHFQRGSFVVKGRTNSRKHEWNRRMFCQTAADIPAVVRSLLDDPLIEEQGLVVREYIPLKKLGVGVNDLPVSHEWRFFCLDGQILMAGYYWANQPETYPRDTQHPPDGARRLVESVLPRLSVKVPFLVVDVAETEDGRWIVIELNDGQMSGLSCIEPRRFYRALSCALGAKERQLRLL